MRGQPARQVIHLLLKEGLNLGTPKQLFAAPESNSLGSRVRFETRKIGHNQSADKLSALAQDHDLRNVRVPLEQIFQLLRGDELPSRSLEQILLAPGDGEESVGVDCAQVAGAKPAIHEGPAVLFVETVVTGRDVRSADQDFPSRAPFLVDRFFCELHLDAGDGSAHGPKLDAPGIVHRDGRRIRVDSGLGADHRLRGMAARTHSRPWACDARGTALRPDRRAHQQRSPGVRELALRRVGRSCAVTACA